MVLSARDGVEGLDGSEEITECQLSAIMNDWDIPRNELGSLVDKLVESVLTVGTALSPDDGLLCQLRHIRVEEVTYSGLVVDPGSVLGNALSVRLHISLLEVIGKLLHVLIIRQQSLGLSTWLSADLSHRKRGITYRRSRCTRHQRGRG